MTSTFEFLLSASALLLTPGPTNTLMALAGLRLGWHGLFRRIMAELSAYLAIVVPLVFVGAATFDRWPELGRVLQFCAALWVGWLAAMLWGGHRNGEKALEVSAVRILITTLLNPKALVFGLVLLPQSGLAVLPNRIALFSCLIVIAACLWTVLGMLASSGRPLGSAVWLQRTASIWMALLSAGLLLRSLEIW